MAKGNSSREQIHQAAVAEQDSQGLMRMEAFSGILPQSRILTEIRGPLNIALAGICLLMHACTADGSWQGLLTTSGGLYPQFAEMIYLWVFF